VQQHIKGELVVVYRLIEVIMIEVTCVMSARSPVYKPVTTNTASLHCVTNDDAMFMIPSQCQHTPSTATVYDNNFHRQTDRQTLQLSTVVLSLQSSLTSIQYK